MKSCRSIVPILWIASLSLGSPLAQAQISSFKHIIVVIQENRSPDNLFQGLCSAPYGSSGSCSTTPTGSQYDIQTTNWRDKTSSIGVTQPGPVPLAGAYDLNHSFRGFKVACDMNSSQVCRMDGSGLTECTGTCPTSPAFKYVDNSTGTVNPYLSLATEYGWANYMFQTNQGPSFPAHQFLFGGTSAPSESDDAAGIFASENVVTGTQMQTAGCIAQSTTFVRLMTPTGENQKIYPCFDHQTLADLLVSNGITWKYYSGSAGGIWTAPNAIQHICQPNMPSGGQCVGPDWVNDVVLRPPEVLKDISNCKLAGVTWSIPSGNNSDHPLHNTGGGPSWVASIVNQVGLNPKCPNGERYWNDTAILITWDDWGGWYDHEPPTILAPPQGDYQYGFRVPFIAVSAYTPAGYVDNQRYDFGSILRFIEKNFGITEGSLNFADARATTNVGVFFNLNQVPRVFTKIPAKLNANYFLTDTTPWSDPDDY
jgi:phospholipase C